MTTNLLVTGGSGFIGSNFIRNAIAGGFYVLNLDLLTYAGHLDSLVDIESHEQYRFVHGDFGDTDLVSRVLGEFKPDAIVNMAAESHVDRSIDGPAAFLKTNVLGTQSFLECTHRYWRELEGKKSARFRFLHISTDEVYGEVETGFFTEKSAYAPNSPYAASKAASDHIVRAYHRTYGLPAIVTNCTNNYGPYQYPEKLIPLVILKALSNEEIPVYGTGKNVRDWIFVDDHCDALFKALDYGRVGETYLIGARNEQRNIDVVKKICSELDFRQPREGGASYASLISFVGDRPGHDLRYAVDPEKAERELHWRVSTRFESALAKTVSWYLNNNEWISSVMRQQNGGERLGLGKNA